MARVIFFFLDHTRQQRKKEMKKRKKRRWVYTAKNGKQGTLDIHGYPSKKNLQLNKVRGRIKA